MKLRIKSTCILFSLLLTFSAYADFTSKWMWHGESSWVYSHAENGWWYLPLVQSGETEPLSGWAWHGALPWVYSHADRIWRYVTPVSGSGFVVWKQGDGQWYAFDEVSKSWNAITAALSEITLEDAFDIEAKLATISCLVNNTGGDDPEITVYWGAWDGSQTFDFWESSEVLGFKKVGVVLKRVVVPNKNTLYYFRFKATNSAGSTWSEVKTFTTLGN